MKTRASSSGRRALPAAGLVALLAFLVARAPTALVASWGRLEGARQASHDDSAAALVRFRGPDYAAAIARIREALPEDAEYLLLETPATMMVRFDLAPRRARFGGKPKDLRVTSAMLPSLPRWTVIPSIDAPGPRLVETRLLAGKVTVP